MLGFFKNVWNGSTANKVMLVFGGVVLVAAVAGVCYGVFAS